MDKIAFTLFGLEVRWYGIILTIGMISALILFMGLCKKRKLTIDFALSIFLFAIPTAIIGARIFYVLPRAEYYPLNSWDAIVNYFAIWEGGLTILGGIATGAIGIYICCLIYKKSPFRIFDLVIPALLLGQIIGRWGNFVNEELHGVAITVEWMKFFPLAIMKNGVWYYASFFYELALNSVGLIIFTTLIFKCKKLKVGFISVMYICWYGIVRGCLEFIKADPFMLPGNIRGAQLVCFIAAIIATVVAILVQTGKLNLESEKMREKHFANLSK